jgi:uncharacterized protein (TIGR02001 family)
MKKFITVIAITGLVTGSAVAGADMTVDIGTAYVFRGSTVADDLVVQPALELSGFGMPTNYGAIAVGVWGSNNDTPSSDSIYETDWYLNYVLPQFVDGLDFYVRYTQYQYSFSVDEKELGLGVDWEVGDFMVGGSANFMLDDRAGTLTEDQKYFDIFGSYELEINENSEVTFGGLIALMFQGDLNSAAGLDDGFNHFELDATYSYALGEMWSLGASVAYIGQLDSNVLPDNPVVPGSVSYDKGLVAFFKVACEM